MGSVVLGRYRVESVVSIGGGGVVYRALDCETGDLVIVKTVRDALLGVPTVAPRFLREARITMRLRHPAIPRGITAGMSAAVPFLVMEYVRGQDLYGLTRSVRLSVPDALRVGGRVAEALSEAHAQGVVHRDIKPENIMLLDGAEIPQGVCVLDFGIAFCADEPRFTAKDSFVGTPEFMSPEQARGEAVTSASDLYALGATLVWVLTGATLYAGHTLVQLASHQELPVPDWRARRPEIPEVVVRAINALLEKDPARRPPSADLVARSLYTLARQVEHPDVPPRSGSGVDILVEFTTVDCDDLVAQLQELQRQHHAVTQDTANAQRKLVQQLVEIAARRQRQGPTRAGEVFPDAAREQALEAALARIQEHSLRQQVEILARMQVVRDRIALATTGRPSR